MQPFVPSDQNLREFSLRAVLIGLVMAVVLGSANAYLGLKAGMTIAATYPAAVIGMALIKLMKGTILEENMARTVGSIGESVAAGAIFTIPAFVISGIWPKFFTVGNYVTSSLIMFAGGVLGIMFVALLRRVMVEDAELPYPESVAAAEIHKAGARGGNGTKFLFGAMGIGAVIQALVQVQLFATTWEKFVGFKATAINLVHGWKAKVGGGMLLSSPGISPAYMGVGYIIGPKLGALNFSGGIIAWGLLVPIITYFLAPGVLPEGASEGDWIALSVSVWKFIVRPIAIGGMLMGACFTLFKMRKSLATGLTRSISDVKKAASGEHVVDRVNKDLPFTYVMFGLGFAALVTFLITWRIFQVSPLVSFVAALVVVILGFFFSAISGYLVGIMGSSNNPISGLTLTALVITALVMVVLGVKGREGVAAVLGVAAVVCVSAAVAGEMLQDLKAGHILGGTPWRMEIGGFIGVLASSLFLVSVISLLHKATPGGLGGDLLPAPQANLMAVTAQGIISGSLRWELILMGVMFAIGLIAVGVPSPMLVAVGMYLPFPTIVAIFAGGLIQWVGGLIAKRKGATTDKELEDVSNRGLLVASGFVAGEALMGIVLAILVTAEIKLVPDVPGWFGMKWTGGVVILGLAAYLIASSLKALKPKK